MSGDHDRLAERLRAVERALVDGDPPEAIASAADLTARVEALETELEELADRLLTVEAVVQALQGYAGHVQHVNRSVGRRADTALGAVEERTGQSDDGVRGKGRNGDQPIQAEPGVDSSSMAADEAAGDRCSGR